MRSFSQRCWSHWPSPGERSAWQRRRPAAVCAQPARYERATAAPRHLHCIARTGESSAATQAQAATPRHASTSGAPHA